jgi:hypothetical protein
MPEVRYEYEPVTPLVSCQSCISVVVVFFLCVLRVGAQEKVKYHAHPAEKYRTPQQEEEDPSQVQMPAIGVRWLQNSQKENNKGNNAPVRERFVHRLRSTPGMTSVQTAAVLCSSYHGSAMIARVDCPAAGRQHALGGLIFVLLWRNMTPQNTRHDATVEVITVPDSRHVWPMPGTARTFF